MSEMSSSDTSDTPKTDEAAFYLKVEDDQYLSCWQWVVDREFARAQERRIAELESACQEIAELISGHDDHVFDDIAKVLLGTKP